MIMALDEKTKQTLMEVGKDVATSVALKGLVMVAKEALESLLASNYDEHDVSGNRKAAPTEDDAHLDKKEADGNTNQGALAKDDVEAQNGEVKATASNVDANENKAIAAHTNANALKTQTGALETAAKALKIN